ncbi:MAG TPA: tetratricopeptide repeat protein [Gemmatimonadales bacterium]
MRRLVAALALSLAASLVLAAPAAAQKKGKTPARPELAATADTNDASSYYDHGLAQLDRFPDRAADAFYWATRLNPASADAFYARRVALLLAKRNLLVRYWSGDRRTMRNRDVQQADSLYLRALTINPFFYQKLDGQFFRAVIRQVAQEAVGPTGNVAAMEYAIESYLRDAPAATRAWRAYSSGQFEEALRLYATAIRGARRKAPLRVDRGRLFFQLDQPDSALVEFELALEEMRKSDAKDLVFVYESKALLEHSVGMVHHRLGRTDAAREAFGRALQEDLSYAPAHVQLGFIALEASDTTTAVSEFDLAVQIAATDPVLRYQYGYTLQELGRVKEAEEQLRKAIELEPEYAAPYFALAMSLAAQGRDAEAVAELRTFLARAPRGDLRREEAAQHLAQLSGGAK